MTSTLLDTPHSNIYNVQPTSDSPKSRTFPTLPDSKDNLKFINNFNFQFSDLTDNEYVTLCSSLVKHENCYATQKTMLEKLQLPLKYV